MHYVPSLTPRLMLACRDLICELCGINCQTRLGPENAQILGPMTMKTNITIMKLPQISVMKMTKYKAL